MQDETNNLSIVHVLCTDITVTAKSGNRYIYKPLEDMTAYELAKILQWQLVAQQPVVWDDIAFNEHILSKPELARHWEKVG